MIQDSSTLSIISYTSTFSGEFLISRKSFCMCRSAVGMSSERTRETFRIMQISHHSICARTNNGSPTCGSSCSLLVFHKGPSANPSISNCATQLRVPYLLVKTESPKILLKTSCGVCPLAKSANWSAWIALIFSALSVIKMSPPSRFISTVRPGVLSTSSQMYSTNVFECNRFTSFHAISSPMWHMLISFTVKSGFHANVNSNWTLLTNQGVICTECVEHAGCLISYGHCLIWMLQQRGIWLALRRIEATLRSRHP